MIPKAKGRAQQRIIEAQAYSINKINQAKGDSIKFKETLKAYKRSPEVTKKRLYLETMHEIFSKAEQMTIVDPKVRGVLPIYGRNIMNQGSSK